MDNLSLPILQQIELDQTSYGHLIKRDITFSSGGHRSTLWWLLLAFSQMELDQTIRAGPVQISSGRSVWNLQSLSSSSRWKSSLFPPAGTGPLCNGFGWLCHNLNWTKLSGLVRSKSHPEGPSETYKVCHQVRVKSLHFFLRRVQVHFVMTFRGLATHRIGPN